MAISKRSSSQVMWFYIENEETRVAVSDLVSADFVGALDISINGGTLASADNEASVAAVDVTNLPGVYELTLSPTETVGLAQSGGSLHLFIDATLIATTEGDNLYTIGPSNPIEFQLDNDWDSLKGEGFSSATDSLATIRFFFDANLQTILSTGLPTTELSGSGWLATTVDKARRWADTPAIDAKFQQSDMIDLIKESSREVFSDVLTVGQYNIGVRFSIQLVTDQQDYILPPNIGRILRVAKVNSDSGVVEWLIDPSTVHSPFPQGFWLEGNVFRMAYKGTWDSDDVIEILYVPNGDFLPAKWDAQAITTSIANTVTLTLDGVTDGVVDKRPNAYAGGVFTLLAATETGFTNQEASVPIASSTNDGTSLVLTLRGDLPVAPETGSIDCEIVPIYSKLFQDVIALHVARSMVTSVKDKKGFDLLTQRYREKARAMRMELAKVQEMTASRFDGRTRYNSDLSLFARTG